MTDKRIRKKLRISGRIKQIATNIPVGIPPVLRRFWGFARDMAKRFSKNFQEDRTEELLNALTKEVKQKGL